METGISKEKDQEAPQWPDIDSRRKTALSATLVVLVILGAYTALQAYSYVHWEAPGMLDPKIAKASVFVSLIILIVTVFYFAVNFVMKGTTQEKTSVYYGSTITVLFIQVCGWLIHIHFNGSQNTVSYFLIPIITIVASWILSWREALALFLLGNTGLFTIMGLEYFGILPYAPLLNRFHESSGLFLSWQIILGNLVTYMSMAIFFLLTTYLFQKMVLNRNRQLLGVNHLLEQELGERKRVEETLAASEREHRLVVENANEAILVVQDGRLKFINPKTMELTGYSREELTSKPFTEFIHPDDREIMTENHLKRLRGEKLPSIYSFRFIDNGGNVRWAEINAVVMPWEGEPATLNFLQDVTERKWAEEASKEGEERFRLLMEHSPLSMAVYDSDGLQVAANRAMEKQWLIDRKETVGKFNVLDSDFLREQGMLHYVQEAYTGRTVHTPEIEIDPRAAFGTSRPRFIQSHLYPLPGPEGSVAGIVVVDEDVTERKRAEDELRREKEFIETALDAQLDTFFLFEPATGKALRWNRSFSRISGYTDEEVARMPAPDSYYSPEDLERASAFTQEVLKEGTGTIELGLICKNGRKVPTEYRVSAIEDEQGKPKYIISIGRDITERKRMEEEITRTRRLESLGILAGGLAHDFNNLLTPILANLSIVKTYGDFDSEIAEMLTDAEKASLRAKGLTQQLLTFAKGGAPIKKTIYLSGLLKDTVEFALSGSNVRCEYYIHDDLWPLEVDEGQISQVIHNMVINADQAMAKGGIMKIRAENLILGEEEYVNLKGGRYVRISVEDRGHGIPQEQLSNIFDPFFTTKEAGRGLGLSTSLSIVTSHEGHIHVDSKIGVGTIFHIYLPSSDKRTEIKETAKDRPIKGEGKVLVIDDEESIRKSARVALKRLGYQVQAAKDHEEGITLYEKAIEGKHPFDAVIMDLTIPGSMGAQEAIKRLKKVDRDAKVIVSSGYSDDRAMSKFREYGFYGVVAKPYEIEDLARVIHNVLKGVEG